MASTDQANIDEDASSMVDLSRYYNESLDRVYLVSMIVELSSLPAKAKAAFLFAHSMTPQVVEDDSPPALFSIGHPGKAKVAAECLSGYWSRRTALLSESEGCYAPIRIANAASSKVAGRMFIGPATSSATDVSIKDTSLLVVDASKLGDFEVESNILCLFLVLHKAIQNYSVKLDILLKVEGGTTHSLAGFIDGMSDIILKAMPFLVRRVFVGAVMNESFRGKTASVASFAMQKIIECGLSQDCMIVTAVSDTDLSAKFEAYGVHLVEGGGAGEEKTGVTAATAKKPPTAPPVADGAGRNDQEPLQNDDSKVPISARRADFPNVVKTHLDVHTSDRGSVQNPTDFFIPWEDRKPAAVERMPIRTAGGETNAWNASPRLHLDHSFQQRSPHSIPIAPVAGAFTGEPTSLRDISFLERKRAAEARRAYSHAAAEQHQMYFSTTAQQFDNRKPPPAAYDVPTAARGEPTYAAREITYAGTAYAASLSQRAFDTQESEKVRGGPTRKHHAGLDDIYTLQANAAAQAAAAAAAALGGDDEGYALPKTRGPKTDEEKRKRNAIYSRRKYVRKKIEHQVLEQQGVSLRKQNIILKNEHTMLQGLLEQANRIVETVESGGIVETIPTLGRRSMASTNNFSFHGMRQPSDTPSGTRLAGGLEFASAPPQGMSRAFESMNLPSRTTTAVHRPSRLINPVSGSLLDSLPPGVHASLPPQVQRFPADDMMRRTGMTEAPRGFGDLGQNEYIHELPSHNSRRDQDIILENMIREGRDPYARRDTLNPLLSETGVLPSRDERYGARSNEGNALEAEVIRSMHLRGSEQEP